MSIDGESKPTESKENRSQTTNLKNLRVSNLIYGKFAELNSNVGGYIPDGYNTVTILKRIAEEPVTIVVHQILDWVADAINCAATVARNSEALIYCRINMTLFPPDPRTKQCFCDCTGIVRNENNICLNNA